ncbi:MAG TPA: MarR family transcriptional regulator [Pseudomonadales bacterium]|jgi:DNA-binding MarR family transcriptional regulator|nr:MarR family transcriptional regulator [Pseudomonadales bacterium]
MTTTPKKMIETCACNKVRTAARLVTRAYDDALRPTGLRASQCAVLAAIAAQGHGNNSMSITELAQAMSMDRSTLKRNVTPLETLGLLNVGAEGWRRSRLLTITDKGKAALEAAVPLWEASQKRLKKMLGADGWSDVQSTLDNLIKTTRE